MTLVDQFESVFRSADRRRYRFGRPELKKALVVTDLEGEPAETYAQAVKDYLVEFDADVEWRVLENSAYEDVDALIAEVQAFDPSLIVSYRNVRFSTWKWPYSLGVYLNVLTRETEYPVLVTPNPHELALSEWATRDTKTIMVLTDHLTGDDRLVDYGVRFIRPHGRLLLTHLEDDEVFERYMDVIGKLPSIDTEIAREDILERLLKEPTDYVDSCREALAEQGHLTHEVVPVVKLGHSLKDYTRIIDEHDVDLLVFNTKEEDDLAMHGKAYTLAVQLRRLPILMV